MLEGVLITIGVCVSLTVHIIQASINEKLKALIEEQEKQLNAQAKVIFHLYRSKANINKQLQ